MDADGQRQQNDNLPEYLASVPANYSDADDPEARWITLVGGDLPCPIAVRLGRGVSGRLCFTGLRIPVENPWRPVEIPQGEWEHDYHWGKWSKPFPAEVSSKVLRQISLGNIMRFFRERAAKDAGSWRAVLDGVAEPAKMTVPRGPKGDPETDQRTLEHYEAALARGLRGIAAVAEVSEELHVSISQVYRRMKRARGRASSEEAKR